MTRLQKIQQQSLKEKAAAMLGVKVSWVKSVTETYQGASVELKHGACLMRIIPTEYWIGEKIG
jgi:hypothetical protein